MNPPSSAYRPDSSRADQLRCHCSRDIHKGLGGSLPQALAHSTLSMNQNSRSRTRCPTIIPKPSGIKSSG